MQYEYTQKAILSTEIDDPQIVETMNALGHNGWQAFKVLREKAPDPSDRRRKVDRTTILFRRPIGL